MFTVALQISHTLMHASYHLPITFYLITFNHSVIKEMDIGPDISSDNCGHDGFSTGCWLELGRNSTQFK